MEKYIKEKNQTNLEKNLTLIKKLSRPAVKYDLIKSAMKEIHPRESEVLRDKQEDQSTVFTEEDFKKFEQSYFSV